jgi:hypothetical protein
MISMYFATMSLQGLRSGRLSTFSSPGRTAPPRIDTAVRHYAKFSRVLFRKLSWAVALVALTAGCTSSDPSPAPTTAGSAPAWTEPAAYSYVLTRGCDEAKPLGRYQVTVAAGAVSATDRLDATEVTPTASADEDLGPATGDSGEEIEAFTLSELVEMAQTATDDGAAVSTSYDTADGHPVKVSIDVGEGPECWNVSDYKA